MRRVTVLGLGLIGGSIGLALRERKPELRVVGIDRPEVITRPAAERAAHELIEHGDAARVEAALAAELVILAAPVSVIRQTLARALDRAEVVLDCGSTKRAICRSVQGHPRRGQFVPGHPMAGLPDGGIDQARADLFEARRWIVCPEQSLPDALARAEDLIRLLGAQVVHLSADEHDRAVARTSHVPQLLASALLTTATSAGAEPAAGPAFASATRVAGGPEAMWSDIFATNADEIAKALGELLGDLGTVQRGLAAEPPALAAALDLLARARGIRRSG
ncbi:MAG TPA: prephenate dehydrogenase/arogenate dehydrogenase family protein [Polyangiaceae bacterium]|nr:prephenate dehydrogenase/arogenate dehydrogenase family protein [Polyangiaceae bacterium]